MIPACLIALFVYVLLAVLSDALRARRDAPGLTLAESATRLARRRR